MSSRANWIPYALIAPSVFFLGAFFIVPLVQTIWLSFSTDDGLSLGNYARMTGDLNFSVAIGNTFLLTLVVVPLQMALAIMMAVMLTKIERGRDLVLWVLTVPLGISDL